MAKQAFPVCPGSIETQAIFHEYIIYTNHSLCSKSLCQNPAMSCFLGVSIIVPCSSEEVMLADKQFLPNYTKHYQASPCSSISTQPHWVKPYCVNLLSPACTQSNGQPSPAHMRTRTHTHTHTHTHTYSPGVALTRKNCVF